MNNKIYPLAYKLSPGQTRPIYYLGFPESWKTALLDIAKKNLGIISEKVGDQWFWKLPDEGCKDVEF